MNKIDKMLTILFVSVLLFITVMSFIFVERGAVPDSLVVGFFGLAGGECGVLGWIKSMKERAQDRKWKLEDRKEKKEAEEECSG